MNIYDELRRLDIETFVAFTFIIASIINITGDNQKRKYLYSGVEQFDENARKLYILVQIITVTACFYFVYRNKNNLENENSWANNIRLIGSILILIGAIMVLISQVTDGSEVESPLI